MAARPRRARAISCLRLRTFGAPGAVEFEMIERRIRPRLGRRGGEAAFMLGEGVRVERILTRQVLRVDKGLGAGDAGAEGGRRLTPFALAIIGVAGRG